jgi:hypothetical protein
MFIGILPTHYEIYAIGETEDEVRKNLVEGYKKCYPPALRSVKPTYAELHDYFGISIYEVDPKKGYTMEG